MSLKLKTSARHDTRELINLFSGDPTLNRDSSEIKPSLYLREMLMSTDERIELLCKNTVKKTSHHHFTGKNHGDFKVIPPLVVFQSFIPGQQCKATVTICNISKVSKQLAIRNKPSPVFSVSYLSKVCSKLAPGMSLQFLVKFIPIQDEDCSHGFTVDTENYSFDVPLLAMGSRPLINFPDSVELKETLVRVPSTKSFFVKNIGNVKGVFSLICEKPFSVSPDKCILDVGKIAQITIKFEVDTVSVFFKQMLVRFETGEELVIELIGSSKEGRIWLDSSQIHLDDTFMGLKRQQQVALHNDTDSAIKFSWHKFETLQYDLDELERMKNRFEIVQTNETIRCTKLEYNGVMKEDDSAKIYSRILDDECRLLTTDDLLFSDKNFILTPMIEELWPGGRCNITVTFSPQAPGNLACTAYCDVMGRATRLPLALSGRALGPVIKMNLHSLDIGPVFLGLNQAYEIVAANKGDIPGRIQYVPTNSIFGGTISCQPEAQCILPYEIKSFVIFFSSSRTGKFVEDVLFKITQSGEEIRIFLKGSVVNPTISFDSTKIDFGIVPVGFPTTSTVNLVNQSQVPVAFALRVPDDGITFPISFQEFADETERKPALNPFCKEFTIFPVTGIIDPDSSLPIEITLITNTIRKHMTVLVAENKNSKLSESVSLSLFYESKVADLSCQPAELVFRFCFIHHEYKHEFTVSNTSNIPAYFYIPVQKTLSGELCCADYTTDITECLLEPGESVNVTATIVPLVTGKVKQYIMVLMFGKTSLARLCSITCSAQGPNVSSNVEALNFGKMALLESKTLTLELSNDSPISATFNVYADEKQQTQWEVEPNSGHLAPGESITVGLTLTVLDPGNVSSTLQVQVENSHTITIGLYASAAGCGITIVPNIFPQIDLGFLFSRRLYQFSLKLYNPGSRHHLVQFIPDRISIRSNAPAALNLFKFTPHKYELAGGDDIQIILEGQSNRELEVSEAYVCWAVINKRGIKQNLGNILINANFIAPMIEMSENLLEFEINIGPDKVQGETAFKTLCLRSVANLEVTMILELSDPFSIIEYDGTRFSETVIGLNPGQEVEVLIGFQPPPQPNLQSVTYTDVLHIKYQEHPQKDKVHLKGKLNFPNLQLSQYEVNFGCIPLDFQDGKELLMINPTPLPVTYSFKWDPDSILITYFEQEKIEDILGADLPDNLKSDPLFHNRQLLILENRKTMMGPLPLIYVEPVPVDPSIFDKEQDCDINIDEKDYLQDILFPLIHPYFNPELPTPEFNTLHSEIPPMPEVSQVFDLTPMFGTLAPFQTQVLNVAFHPRPFMGVVATATCTVLGGPTVTLRIIGQSARHLFSLTTTFINFGFRMFRETCEEVIQLTNMSQLPFRFKIFSPSTPPNSLDLEDGELGKITVEPPFGEVSSQSSASISVKFYPGLDGEFQQVFTIQVGYLEPVKVLVTGYGVMPQVSVNLRHISRPRVPVGWGYAAVASLTSARFYHLTAHHRSPKPHTPDQGTNQDWVCIDFTDSFPTNDDIWLALERLIAYHFVKDNSLNLSRAGLKTFTKTIPQLVLPGYVLDFGSVVVGTTTQLTIMVENRGLVRADVNLALSVPEKKLKQDGFYINFQKHIGLPVGRSVPLYITIKPTFQRYCNNEELLHFIINLQVVNGGTLPIYTKALLTVPHIVIEPKTLHFGEVKCGYCSKLCLLMKNSGAVEVEWSATLLECKRRKQNSKESSEQEKPFFINQTSALFLPKTAELLVIGFMPKEERMYETTLKIEVKHNPEKVMVKLQGEGVEPKITITPQTIHFGANIPYSGVVEREFTVTNTSPFNIQLYFPDFDRYILKEDRILRVLTHLYNADRMFLSLDLYDNKSSPQLEEIYSNLVNEARAIRRISQVESIHSEISRQTPTSSQKYKREISEFVLESKTLTDYLRKHKTTYELDSVPDPFASLTSNEVEQQLIETINSTLLANSNPDIDPLRLKEKTEPIPPSEPRDYNKGILLVFHGAPTTEYLYWASRTAKTLSLSVQTLDELILQEAAKSFKVPAIQICEAINNAYFELVLPNQETDRKMSEECYDIGFEELRERVKTLQTPQKRSLEKDVMKDTGSKKSPKSPKGTASKPGTAKKPITAPDTFGDIPIETYVELIRDRLLEEVERGLILEKLTGFFLNTVSAAVKVILKCVGHISCLEFISIYTTQEETLAWNRICHLKGEMKRKAIEHEKMLLFEEMSHEELAELSSEDKLLFDNTVLADRRLRLNTLRRRRLTASPSPSLPASPFTQKSLKSKIKSIDGNENTKVSKNKQKVKSKKGKSSASGTLSPIKKLSRQSSTRASSIQRKKYTKIDHLEEEFAKYNTELNEIIILLSRWNKKLADFEDLSRHPSLFNIPKPQTRKDKKGTFKVADKLTQSLENSDFIGVALDIVKVPQNPENVWFDGLIKHLLNHESFLTSQRGEKEWCDISVPDPLTLACISKPDIRIPSEKLEPFVIKNQKLNHTYKLGFNIDDQDDFSKKSLIEELPVNEEQQIIKNEKLGLDELLFSHHNGLEDHSLPKLKTVYEQNIISSNGKISERLEDSLETHSLKSEEDAEGFITRVELAPGEYRSWNVWYEPTETAVFLQNVKLEIGGWRKKYQIQLAAVCDIPRIDPNPTAIFKKVNETINPISISHCVFIEDEKLFYFGPVFATIANKERTNDLASNFYFTNISEVKAEIKFSLEDSSSENPFGFNSNELCILPGETKHLEVYACPKTIGKFTETLVYTIKNNPEPGFIKMSCIGIKPDFEYEPKVVRFERILLYRKEVCQLTLTNLCYKPLGWRLVDLPRLGKQISVSQESGVMPALQTADVYIYFSAQYVEVATHTIIIEVYDDQFRGQPFFSESIPVILESVDVLVDILFSKQKTSELKFEAVKVGEPETQTIVMKNKGKYDVKFQIKFDKEAKIDFDPEQVFTFSPKTGVLPTRERPVQVKITCMCSHPVHVHKVPVLKVWLVDTGPQAQQVAAIPINVTIDAFTSRFKITPEAELNYGPILVGAKKIEPIIIENIGQFEFTFQILTLEQAEWEKKEEKLRTSNQSKSVKSTQTKSNKESAKTKSGKAKKLSKIRDWPSLTTGVFTLSHSGGVVLPGSSFTIDVVCNANSEDTFNQVVVIKLLEYPWNKNKGIHLKLTATAYLPYINFNNLNHIFREALIDPSKEVVDDGEPHIIYNKELNELRFVNACVGVTSSLSLHLHLHNSGLVPCEASAAMVVPPNTVSAFQVMPNKFTIMSHSELPFMVSFLPTQIGTFTELLQVQVALPSPLESQKFSATMVGEAHLPQISLKQPHYPLTSLNFPPTHVGSCTQQQLEFFNSGVINCSVIAEVCENDGKAFSFFPISSDHSLHEEATTPQLVKLKKGELCGMEVRFQPQKSGLASCQVKLYISNNPYEDQTVAVQGVGYRHDVVLEGLPLVPDQKLSSRRIPDDRPEPVKYMLQFGPCNIGETMNRVLTLKNQTEDSWYRFLWDREEHLSDLIVISPSAGHLPPESAKDIQITFYSDQPQVRLRKEPITCVLTEILLLEKSESSLGWDNHQKIVNWGGYTDDSGMLSAKRILIKEEPKFEEIPATSISLAVLISASADYTQVTCSTDPILFHVTIIHQVEEQHVVLSNTGSAPAVFTWSIKDQVQDCPRESAKITYEAVTMSRERPELKLVRPIKHNRPTSRPATCPQFRPGPIPSSVSLISLDDITSELVHPKYERKPYSWPITMNPLRGKIPPGEQVSCIVTFQPMEMANYTCFLHLSVDNEEPQVEKTILKVEGSSILPCCHLAVPDYQPSDNHQYLQIHFKVLGVGKPVHKVVSVVNTTNDDYTFYWKEITGEKLSPFSCATPLSPLNASKYIDVIFSFLPKAAGTYKSLWQLSIPKWQIKQNIKIVGVATEPYVCLLPTFLRLKPTLIGVKSEGKVTLINNEDCDLNFKVDPNSLFCGSWGQSLQIQPMKGIVPAQSQVDLRVSVKPTEAGSGLFRLSVLVSLLAAPIQLDVEGECFQVLPALVYHDLDRARHQLSADRSNTIDIGNVEFRIPLTLMFTLSNIGKPAFHYNWHWDADSLLNRHLSITTANTTGVVSPQAKVPLTLQVTPLARAVFKEVKIQLSISKGPTYVILLSGNAAQAFFKFSFNKYDFGRCFVQSSDNEYHQTNLVFCNIDERPLLIECQFECPPHLRVGLTQSSVQPRTELCILISFLPRASQLYQEQLTFLINGSHTYTVTVTGVGVDYNLMLVDPGDKLLTLEGVLVGRVRRRRVVVVNKSEASLIPTFSLEPATRGVSLAPVDPLMLKSNKKVTLTITFSPDKVVKGIEQELCWSFQDAKQVLSAIKAYSVGVSVVLDRDYVPFGSTVIGNTSTTKLIFSNNGDLAVKFLWTVKNEEFAISPKEGYIAAGTDITLTASFSPNKLQTEVHCQAVCTLTNHKDLVVKLSGSCIDLPPSTMTIPLTCLVRQSTSSQIPIFNKFGQEVTLTAVISGEYFSGDQVSSIPPYGTHLFEITYSPMAITTAPEVHKGTALFYFVDGSCLVYALEGSAGPPTAADKLTANLSTHTTHTLTIPVHNWLQTPQKFKVSHSLESSSVPNHKYQLTCNEYFMISGFQTRDLCLKIVSHFPGTLNFKVILTNESTGEYEWFVMVCEVEECGPLEHIELSSAVRQPVYHGLVFHNPLDSAVTLHCTVSVEGLSTVNTPLTVNPFAQVEVLLKYLPLWPCNPTASRLELSCAELGVFPYTVITSALPAPPLAPLFISCDLGRGTHIDILLTNPTSTLAVFTCTSSHEDFTVESLIHIPPEESKKVMVSFQPSALNDIRDITARIIATSQQAGQFVFTIIGTVTFPEPRGPYTLSPGTTTTVSIKNVFKENKNFVFSVDNPSFVVRETSAVLQPDEEVKVIVEMVGSEITEFPLYPVTGKLSVSVADDNLSHIKWTFYLRGLLQHSDIYER